MSICIHPDFDRFKFCCNLYVVLALCRCNVPCMSMLRPYSVHLADHQSHISKLAFPRGLFSFDNWIYRLAIAIRIVCLVLNLHYPIRS